MSRIRTSRHRAHPAIGVRSLRHVRVDFPIAAGLGAASAGMAACARPAGSGDGRPGSARLAARAQAGAGRLHQTGRRRRAFRRQRMARRSVLRPAQAVVPALYPLDRGSRLRHAGNDQAQPAPRRVLGAPVVQRACPDQLFFSPTRWRSANSTRPTARASWMASRTCPRTSARATCRWSTPRVFRSATISPPPPDRWCSATN